MGILSRDTGMRAVKKTMRRLPEHERQQGMGLAEGAEQTFRSVLPHASGAV